MRTINTGYAKLKGLYYSVFVFQEQHNSQTGMSGESEKTAVPNNTGGTSTKKIERKKRVDRRTFSPRALPGCHGDIETQIHTWYRMLRNLTEL